MVTTRQEMGCSGSNNGPNKRLDQIPELLNRKEAHMDHIEHEFQVVHKD